MALVVVAASAGCRLETAEAPAPAEPTPAVVARALGACTSGDTDAGIATLDAALDADARSADALTARGLCHWTRFAADSARADAEAAHADLSAAIEAARAGPDRPPATPLDRVYSHRAFVALALDPDDWSATVADLTSAVRLAPRDPTHRLDRAVAHRAAGDTAAARRDLRRFLALAPPADAARRGLAEQMLADLE